MSSDSSSRSSGSSSPEPEAESDTTSKGSTQVLDADVHDDDDEDEGVGRSPLDAASLNSRAYQLEMLEASLRENIIVAMDTGSGKTQVAVLRIAKEIERSPPDKVIWFLAPTVELCYQQKAVIQNQMPAVQVKILSSREKVDTWSTRQIWAAVLSNVRVVVATYQVLLDALTHAFVLMEDIPLLVFDEAHNCKSNSPGRRIMITHYFPRQQSSLPVPHILGLTASPILGSRLEDIETLEKTLDARCKSPHMHRDELANYVNCPVLSHVTYIPEPEDTEFTPTLLSLHAAANMDILEDPWVIHLQNDKTEEGRRRLHRTIMMHSTVCQKLMKNFVTKSHIIFRQLGAWAADYFVVEIIKSFTAAQGGGLLSVQDQERMHLVKTLQKVVLPMSTNILDYERPLSGKVEVLLRVLDECPTDTIGIIFVQERATTIILDKLISILPRFQDHFRTGSTVGQSSIGAKEDVTEFIRARKAGALHKFREKKINLLVATNVLEEGIDIPACNLVLCFDKPANLKSFIQRRGRARMRESRVVILDEPNSTSRGKWELLEAEMKSRYRDEEREIDHLTEIEESEAGDLPFYETKKGAKLHFGQAVAHLHHFCGLLSKNRFADPRPDFISMPVVEEDGAERDGEKGEGDKPVMLRAKVEMPIFVPQNLRSAESSRAWAAEKNAFADAAFQAYINLHKAGLVNDNLMPISVQDFMGDVEFRDAFAMVSPRYNPWFDVAKAWVEGRDLLDYPLRFLGSDGEAKAEFMLTLPWVLPEMKPTKLYMDRNTEFVVEIGRPGKPRSMKTRTEVFPDHTKELFSLGFCHRWKAEDKQHVVQIHSKIPLAMEQIGGEFFDPGALPESGVCESLVRDVTGHPFYYHSMLPAKPHRTQIQKRFFGFDDAPEEVPYVAVKKFSKRNDLRYPSGAPSGKASQRHYSAIAGPDCKVDTVSFIYPQFSMCIPSIIRMLEVPLVAKYLGEKVLGRLDIKDGEMLTTAICAGSAHEASDYQRLEFLGDTVLKLCTSVNCAAEKLHWPEGYLSKMKDHYVSNSRLSRATCESGVDKFILTDPFKTHRWKPIYVPTILSSPTPPPRKLSTKTLADVVESLIGASYLQGGFDAALFCISTFLPDREWWDLKTCHEVLFEAAPEGLKLPAVFEPLERLLGYEFRKKALLMEAMTHASYKLGGPVGSLDRLEFVGDAILDSIVVRAFFDATLGKNGTGRGGGAKGDTDGKKLSLYKLHEMRTALVNADILGFLCMEWSVLAPKATLRLSVEADAVAFPVDDVGGGASGRGKGTKRKRERGSIFEKVDRVEEVVGFEEDVLPLWKFLRHSNPDLGFVQNAMGRRHLAARGEILDALKEGDRYPWHLIASLQTPKFYSDMVEAVIGAVWVDSGDLNIVEGVVEKLGLMGLMRRLLRDEVDTIHPKNKVGELAEDKKVVYDVWVVVNGWVAGTGEDGAGGGDGGSSDSFTEYETASEGSVGGGLEKGYQGSECDDGPERYRRKYGCRLLIGGVCRIQVRGGVSREEVKVKAALEAVLNWDAEWVAGKKEDKEDEEEEEGEEEGGGEGEGELMEGVATEDGEGGEEGGVRWRMG